jgi:NADH:ubiquinone oxidoreductase subunit K
MTIGLGHYLTVAALLFTLGIFGGAAELEYPWP